MTLFWANMSDIILLVIELISFALQGKMKLCFVTQRESIFLDIFHFHILLLEVVKTASWICPLNLQLH